MYSDLMHGYYDARAGIQMSPSIRHFPHSAYNTENVEPVFESDFNDIYSPYPYAKDDMKIPLYGTDTIFEESSPTDTATSGITSKKFVTDDNWFTPYAYHNEMYTDVDPAINPTSISYHPNQEIVLRPSLPRHSSTKAAHSNTPDSQELPIFDPSLSTVAEEVEYYNFPQASRYPSSTSNWVNRHTPSLMNNRTAGSSCPQASSNQYLAGHGSTLPTNPASPMHVVIDTSAHQPSHYKQDLEPRSSVGSSIAEMKSHYNRDRLLGTVEKVRSTSSRSKRPGSFASANSLTSQFSPAPQYGSGYQYSPFYEPEPERYPELTSPVYYNNNNNRHSLTSQQGGQSPTRHLPLTRESSRQTTSCLTSGLGTTWSQSKMDSSTQTRQPYQSPLQWNSTLPHHDISEEPPLPPYYRYFGLYARPTTPSQDEQLSWRRYNSQHYIPSPDGGKSSRHDLDTKITGAASDSVDENYEFDPILIDSEPQDFFHIHDDMIKDGTSSSDSQEMHRPPLYAEKRLMSPVSEQSRFEQLKKEYLTFRERQNQLVRQLSAHRLESDIL